MKRASYRDAIAWIADNDSPADYSPDDAITASELITAVFVADIFAVPYDKVGRDIVRYRQRQDGIKPNI